MSTKKIAEKILNFKIILSIALVLISFEIFLGSVVGYITGKIFAGKREGKQGIFKSIKINFGKYHFHLHHWLIYSVVLASAFIWNFLPYFKFSFGFLGGMIYQGIFCYDDWRKILIKKRHHRED